MTPEEKNRKEGRSVFSSYAPYLSLGLEIAAGISVPILLGFWLDGRLDTSPWLLLAGCVIGMVNTFLLIFKLYRDLDKS